MSGFPFPGRGAASLAASPPPNPRSSICRLQKLPILSTGLEPYLTCVCDLVPPEWELCLSLGLSPTSSHLLTPCGPPQSLCGAGTVSDQAQPHPHLS